MKHLFLATLVLAFVRVAASCGGSSEPPLALILEPAPDAESVSAATLEQARDVIDKRLDMLDIDGSASIADGRIDVRADGIDATKQALLIRAGLLMFCEPVVNDDGDIAIRRDGDVSYEPGTCEPERDAAGDIVVEGGDVQYVTWDVSVQTFAEDDIVWQPAKSELHGHEVELTGDYLRTTFVTARDLIGIEGEPFVQEMLAFEMNGDGAEILGSVTQRLVSRNYPMAFFLDGQPIRGEDGTIIAPAIQAELSASGIIEGLTTKDAQELSDLLNAGTLPFRLSVYQQLY